MNIIQYVQNLILFIDFLLTNRAFRAKYVNEKDVKLLMSYKNVYITKIPFSVCFVSLIALIDHSTIKLRVVRLTRK